MPLQKEIAEFYSRLVRIGEWSYREDDVSIDVRQDLDEQGVPKPSVYVLVTEKGSEEIVFQSAHISRWGGIESPHHDVSSADGVKSDQSIDLTHMATVVWQRRLAEIKPPQSSSTG